VNEQTEGSVVEEGARQAPSEDEPDTDEKPLRAGRWIAILEWFDEKVYVLVGLTFLLAALLSLVYGLLAMGDNLFLQMFLPSGFKFQALFASEAGAEDIISLVSDLLLTLIIMEVLGTVVHHLQDGETTLRPFLFIGIISATRGILAVGARLSVATNGAPSTGDFIRDMVELGVNAIVIIALGVTMKLIGHYLEVGATPKHDHPSRGGGRSTSPNLPTASAGQAKTVISGTPAVFALMILIILVALALIVVLFSVGHI
jgi:Phosphate-starvation-inducible E family